MTMTGVAGLHQSTPAELKAQLEAERAGEPFLLYKDPSQGQAIVPLAAARVTVGRGADAQRLERQLDQPLLPG